MSRLFVDPMDCNPPHSSVHGILQARILEWVAISFSRGFSQRRDRTRVSYVSCTGRWVLHHKCHTGRKNIKMLNYGIILWHITFTDCLLHIKHWAIHFDGYKDQHYRVYSFRFLYTYCLSYSKYIIHVEWIKIKC